MVRKRKDRMNPGDVLPDFMLYDLDGRVHHLREWRGRIVLLNFWSAECPWSLRADDLLRTLLVQWGAGVVYLPVACNANESPAQLRRAASARALPLVLWDEHCQVADACAAEVTPEFLVIDREGRLAYQGALDDVNFRQREPTRCYVCEVVTLLLENHLPETDHTAAFGCAITRFTDLVA